MEEERKSSYKGILKSTTIVGGAQILQIGIGIVRTKVVAVLLGPIGVGVMGIFQSILDLTRSVTGMGINMSGVRDVAEAKNSGEEKKIQTTVSVLNGWALATGLLGVAVMFISCMPLSKYAFGDYSYSAKIAIISIALIFISIAQAKSSLLQGMQKYSLLAKSNILIAIASLVISIPLYFLFGLDGIVPSIILLYCCNMLVNIFYTKKLNIKREKIGVGVGFKKGLRMAKLGLFMVVNSFMATGTMLVIRSFISNHSGISEVGLFQAMWTVSTSFVGIVLNAMLTDFFPRLSGISTDNSSMNRLTNEQCEITLILGSPILIALLAFSRIVVSILYSGDFIRAIPLLQWLNAASFITLISWPVGVIFLAKGKGSFSVLLDTIGSICFIVIGVVLWRQVGILAFGISALVRAFLNIIVAFLLGRKASGFSYSWKYLRLLTLFFIPFALGFIFQLIRVKYLSDAVAYIAFIFTCVVAYLELAKRVNLKSFLSRYLPIKKNV